MQIPDQNDGNVEVPERTLVAGIVQRVLQSARHGEYRSLDRLPSEREFAEQLRVSRNTVTAAYAELERKGVIRRIHGKGAYLCALPLPGESFSWSGKVSRFANALDEPVLELLARRCAAEIAFPLSAGTPSLEVFPKNVYAAAMARVVEGAIPQALAVAPTEGQWRLRQALGAWLDLSPQNVMITMGAQEGIDLLARCLIEPNDYVVVDAPTYPGALQSFLSTGARLLPWGTSWSLGQLEELLLRYRPKLLFTMPTFHNPTGRVMSLKTRLGLLALAARYGVPIIEDDVYSRTFFTDDPMPDSLYRLDKHSQVIAVSTFSKIFAPGLRVGWITAPPYMIKQLALIKMRSNLFTGGLNQLVMADILEQGEMENHLGRLRAHHRFLCSLAMRCLEPAVHQGFLQCRVPSGSLYLWCKVLLPLDVDALIAEWEMEGISVAPGVAFEPDRKRHMSTHFRLCFSAVTAEQLSDGIEQIHRSLERASGISLRR